MKIFITGHSCAQNAIVNDRFWLVDLSKMTFKHLGTADLDKKFLEIMLKELNNIEMIQMYIHDNAFKFLLITLGYKQL